MSTQAIAHFIVAQPISFPLEPFRVTNEQVEAALAAAPFTFPHQARTVENIRAQNAVLDAIEARRDAPLPGDEADHERAGSRVMFLLRHVGLYPTDAAL